MKSVQIYKLENNGDQTVLTTCKLVNETIILEPENSFMMKEFVEKGIKNYENKTVLYPTDGEEFLKHLKFHFKSGYLNASDVIEE